MLLSKQIDLGYVKYLECNMRCKLCGSRDQENGMCDNCTTITNANPALVPWMIDIIEYKIAEAMSTHIDLYNHDNIRYED